MRRLDVYEWGEWAVTGAGYQSDSIEEDLMLRQEFGPGSGDFGNDSTKMAIAISQRFSDVIGGNITHFAINNDGIHTIAYQLSRQKIGSNEAEVVYRTALRDGKLYGSLPGTNMLVHLESLDETADTDDSSGSLWL
jgi:hypothetical protein